MTRANRDPGASGTPRKTVEIPTKPGEDVLIHVDSAGELDPVLPARERS